MCGEKTIKLKNMLEVAVEQGVLLYQNEEPATPSEIAQVQSVNEEYNYLPDFMVKDETGEIKEIWYSGTINEMNDINSHLSEEE